MKRVYWGCLRTDARIVDAKRRVFDKLLLLAMPEYVTELTDQSTPSGFTQGITESRCARCGVGAKGMRPYFRGKLWMNPLFEKPGLSRLSGEESHVRYHRLKPVAKGGCRLKAGIWSLDVLSSVPAKVRHARRKHDSEEIEGSLPDMPRFRSHTRPLDSVGASTSSYHYIGEIDATCWSTATACGGRGSRRGARARHADAGTPLEGFLDIGRLALW